MCEKIGFIWLLLYDSILRLALTKTMYHCFRYGGFAIERDMIGGNSFEDKLEAFFNLIHSILLGSFAIMLGEHRSSILEKDGNNGADESQYNPPAVS